MHRQWIPTTAISSGTPECPSLPQNNLLLKWASARNFAGLHKGREGPLAPLQLVALLALHLTKLHQCETAVYFLDLSGGQPEFYKKSGTIDPNRLMYIETIPTE